MLVFPRLKLSGGGSTTANCWLSIGGQYGETEQIQLPKHTLDITIKVVSSVCQLECCTGAGAVNSRGIPAGLPRDRDHFFV